jgi:hypothetical protein
MTVEGSAAAPAPKLEAVDASSLFNPSAPAPPQAIPPADSALTERIKLLVRYVAQSGPAFLDTVRAKQGGNPEYAFLEPGGEGHDFYRWALHSALRGGDGEQAQHGLPQGQPHTHAPAYAAQGPVAPAPQPGPAAPLPAGAPPPPEQRRWRRRRPPQRPSPRRLPWRTTPMK